MTSRIEEPGARRLAYIAGPPPFNSSNSRFFGLANRRERWGLSWKGWLVIAVLIISFGICCAYSAYPFLAITHRVDGDVLVVEGWVHEYALRAAINELQAGHYQHVFTTGGPISGMGGYTNDYNTSASLGAGRLKAEGVSPDLVQMVPSRVIERDRTYSAARALRDWFAEHHAMVHGVNVVTEDVHARRTRLLFQKALGDRMKVGVIAVRNPDYDASHWWCYSEGVRDVISESVAYAYARGFFWPERQEKPEQEIVRSGQK